MFCELDLNFDNWILSKLGNNRFQKGNKHETLQRFATYWKIYVTFGWEIKILSSSSKLELPTTGSGLVTYDWMFANIDAGDKISYSNMLPTEFDVLLAITYRLSASKNLSDYL